MVFLFLAAHFALSRLAELIIMIIDLFQYCKVLCEALAVAAFNQRCLSRARKRDYPCLCVFTQIEYHADVSLVMRIYCYLVFKLRAKLFLIPH